MSVRYGTIEQRFWSDVHPEPNAGCWLWSGPADENGYGRFRVGSKKVRVHRISYEMANNVSLSSNQCLLHSCDNPGCVNPDHLRIGTHADNVADKVSRNRQAKGENLHSKLNDADITEIRQSGDTQREIAKRYGVAHTTIGAIKRRQKWKHLP